MKPADAVDKWGNTPLINACQEGDLAKLKSLLKQRANPNIARQSDGNAPLHIITGLDGEQALPAGESLLFINALIQSGANVNLANKEGKTPLMLTCVPTEIDALVKAGAQVNLQDRNGQTALMAAAQQNRTEAVMKLLQCGASLNVQDKQGKTALMLAAEAGNTETVELLMKSGANVRLKDKNGYTALDHEPKPTLNHTPNRVPHLKQHLQKFSRVEEGHLNKPENNNGRM